MLKSSPLILKSSPLILKSSSLILKSSYLILKSSYLILKTSKFTINSLLDELLDILLNELPLEVVTFPDSLVVVILRDDSNLINLQK